MSPTGRMSLRRDTDAERTAGLDSGDLGTTNNARADFDLAGESLILLNEFVDGEGIVPLAATSCYISFRNCVCPI